MMEASFVFRRAWRMAPLFLLALAAVGCGQPFSSPSVPAPSRGTPASPAAPGTSGAPSMMAAPAVLATGVNSGHILREDAITRVLSATYQVQGLYRSMLGPYSTERLTVLDRPQPELVWLTGYNAHMVAEDGQTEMPQRYMCHSNLDFNPGVHRNRVASSRAASSRLFTLSQGQFVVEFPPGFGIPMMSDEVLSLTTQVLNLHDPNDRARVRHNVGIRFVPDRDAAQPMRPLFPTSAYGLVTLEEGGVCYNSPHDGPSCLPGAVAEGGAVITDRLGRRFSGHWIVPPGKHVYRTDCTTLMNIPWDTTVHYIATHLHPFAESLELVDRTAGTTVFQSLAVNTTDIIGLEHVDYFSSVEGVPLYKDHQYEIIARYDNTSGQNQDSMAVMYMYVLDKEFQRPGAASATP